MEFYDFFLSETLSETIPSASYGFDEKGLTLPFVFMLKYCGKNSLFANFYVSAVTTEDLHIADVFCKQFKSKLQLDCTEYFLSLYLMLK